MASLPIISQIYVVSTLVGSAFMALSVLVGHLPRAGALHGHGVGHGGQSVGHGGQSVGHGGQGVGHGGQSVGHGGQSVGHGGQGVGHGGQSVGHGGQSVGHGGQSVGHGGQSVGHGGQSIGHGGQSVGHGGQSIGHGGQSVGHGGQSVGHGGQSVITGRGDVASHGAAPGQSQLIPPEANSDLSMTLSPKLQASTGPLHIGIKEDSVVEFVLGLLNPFSIATFLAFFGVTGMLLSIALGFNALICLPIALFAGWLAVQVVVRTVAWMFFNMGVSSEARVDDLVGHMGEITVPISSGRTGQVTYIIQSKRYTSPAKSVDPNLELSKKTKVIICDIKDHVMYVDLWNDSFTDPMFDVTQEN